MIPSGIHKSAKQSAILHQCTTFLFDCDGVLWNASGLLTGAASLIKFLLDSGKRVFLITNNSTKSVEQYAEKCRNLGLAVSKENIICSSNVAANYLQRISGISGPVYVIGEEGIGLELDKHGISHFGIGPDQPPEGMGVMQGIDLDPNTTAVLVGFDIYFNYRKLLKATSYITRGLPFFATNEDALLPGVLPGTGSIVAAVKYASGKEPIVMGKPHAPIFNLLERSHQLDLTRTVMVGDRLDTDILFGNRFGIHTACVLSGVTDLDLLDRVASSETDKLLRPSFVFPSVQELFDTLLRRDDEVA